MTDDDKLSLAASYAAATRAGNTDAMAALSEPDAVVWHNFDDLEVDMARTATTLQWLHRTAPDVTWDDVAVTPTATGFVWQALLHGTGPGGPFRAHTCMVATVSPAGRVARLAEYLDPAALGPLQG